MSATQTKTKAKPNTTTKAPAKREAKGSEPLDAIALLTGDHQEVQTLFKAYQKLVDDDGEEDLREQLAQEICSKLTVHATIEEELFYPAARESLGDEDGDDLLDEAEVEHASAKDLIAQISEGSASDELYDAKVKVLGEYIAHHVKEEEKELFPKVKKSALDLDALGEELSARKSELMLELEEAETS
ncbi:Hemerythrin HHE cation binding domain-containing protein [Roseateles sp. YR242]|uniref:hemerythrin domain-containing protein n=1 Tax=Roseateles sp. YR242 TaxID=1855305 RepID=UPI0008AF7B6A|nr:hemerythrin domain-containing protein [Roseateles sp. YR242]SEK23009.1 Hemerythrin HHE cation binding domain-containing protein [Roseateles sp. YR242]